MSTREIPAVDPSPLPRSAESEPEVPAELPAAPSRRSRKADREPRKTPKPPRRPAVVYDDQVAAAQDDNPPPVQVRRVRRVVRRVDTWSVFRFSLMLYLCALVVGMVALVGMWVVASVSGAIPSIENFITQLFALKKFTFKPVQMLLASLAIGIIGVFVATMLTVMTSVLFNLISDVVGGVEVTVLEEEPLEVVG
jgi:hypothetical protein